MNEKEIDAWKLTFLEELIELQKSLNKLEYNFLRFLKKLEESKK